MRKKDKELDLGDRIPIILRKEDIRWKFQIEENEAVLRIQGSQDFLRLLIAQSIRVGPENSAEGIYHWIVSSVEVEKASFTYKTREKARIKPLK